MFRCSYCHSKLLLRHKEKLPYYYCRPCDASGILVRHVRYAFKEELFDKMIAAAKRAKPRPKKCFCCRSAYGAVRINEETIIDICPKCHSFWFDRGEIESSELSIDLYAKDFEKHEGANFKFEAMEINDLLNYHNQYLSKHGDHHHPTDTEVLLRDKIKHSNLPLICIVIFLISVFIYKQPEIAKYAILMREVPFFIKLVQLITHNFVTINFEGTILNLGFLILIGRNLEQLIKPKDFIQGCILSCIGGGLYFLMFEKATMFASNNLIISGVTGMFYAGFPDAQIISTQFRRIYMRSLVIPSFIHTYLRVPLYVFVFIYFLLQYYFAQNIEIIDYSLGASLTSFVIGFIYMKNRS